MSFFNNNICYYILNIYSDSSHTALKYLKNTEVNIDNVVLMTGDFNIRDSLWDPSFSFHSSISDDLIIIADSFDLALSTPTNPCPTRYSDTAGESNSVIDLMFLYYGSSELDHHTILPESRLSSDHAPFSIDIPIFKEIIQTSKLTLAPKSDHKTAFIKDIISNFKILDTSNIEDIGKLEQVVNQLGIIVDQAWTKNTKNRKIPSTPNNGGQKNVNGLLIITDHQEASKTGRSSRRQSKTSRDSSSTTKFKKSRIKVKAHGS